MNETQNTKQNDSEVYASLMRKRLGPRWRWQLVQQFVADAGSVTNAYLDEVSLQLVEYLRAVSCGKLADIDLKIAEAADLQDDDDLRRTIQMLILGDCDRDMIATRLGINGAVLRIFEDVYFDVRSRLAATSWIHRHVIKLEPDADWELKLAAAHAGGPAIAAALLDAEELVPLDQVRRLRDQRIQLHLRYKQALELPIKEPADGIKLVKANLDCQYREKRLELAEAKFRQRAEHMLRQHELRERQQALSEQRHHQAQLERRQRIQEHKRRDELQRCQALEVLQQLAESLKADEGRRCQASGAVAATGLAKLSWQQRPVTAPVLHFNVPEKMPPTLKMTDSRPLELVAS